MDHARLSVGMDTLEEANSVMTTIQTIMMDAHRPVNRNHVTSAVNAMDGFYHGSTDHAQQFVAMVSPEELRIAMMETRLITMDARLYVKVRVAI